MELLSLMRSLAMSVIVMIFILSPSIPLGNGINSGSILFGLAGPQTDKSLISINPDTAATSVIGKVGSRHDLEGLAFNPADGFLYGSTGWKNPGGPALIRIDPSTGASETVGTYTSSGGEPDEIDALSFHPITGVLYGVNEGGPPSGGELYTIDINTGRATIVGDLGPPFGGGDPGIAFDSYSTLYGVSKASDQLFTIDITTGTAIGVGPLGFDSVVGLCFHPETGVLFGIDIDSRELITIDKTTGEGSLVGELTGPVTDYPVALAFMPTRLTATVDIDPDTLNLKSLGKLITAYVELPEDYNVSDIDIATILLNDTIPAEMHPTGIGDEDNDGIPDLMVKFDRATVIEYIKDSMDWSNPERTKPLMYEIALTVTGMLYDQTPFEGSDAIRTLEFLKGHPEPK